MTADYVCTHCGEPAWDWDGEDEYVCPNGCASDTMPGTTILRAWDDFIDVGKLSPTRLDLTRADVAFLRRVKISVEED
jgi:hypothetical protein